MVYLGESAMNDNFNGNKVSTGKYVSVKIYVRLEAACDPRFARAEEALLPPPTSTGENTRDCIRQEQFTAYVSARDGCIFVVVFIQRGPCSECSEFCGWC